MVSIRLLDLIFSLISSTVFAAIPASSVHSNHLVSSRTVLSASSPAHSHLQDRYLEERDVDLTKYPEVIRHWEPGDEISIGDLHGNSLKLVHFLIREGILSVTPNEYEELAKLYGNNDTRQVDPHFLNFGNYQTEKSRSTSRGIPADYIRQIFSKGTTFGQVYRHPKAQIQFALESDRFLEIVSNAVIPSSTPLIRFIGDEVADRGKDDFWTLRILEKLKLGGVQYKILLSNHGLDFIALYESLCTKRVFAPMTLGFQIRSLLPIRYRLDRKLISWQEFEHLVESVYFPHLILMDYHLDPSANVLSLFTHAPVGIEAIDSFARRFHLDCSGYRNSVQQLTGCIDSVNAYFHDWMIPSKSVTDEVANEPNLSSQGTAAATPNTAFTSITWNRYDSSSAGVDTLDRPQQIGSTSIRYIHGHDTSQTCQTGILFGGKVINLDNEWGKWHPPFGIIGGKNPQGQLYTIYVSKTSTPIEDLTRAMESLTTENLSSLAIEDQPGGSLEEVEHLD